jgi:flagellar hook-basal body complex protein FliE
MSIVVPTQGLPDLAPVTLQPASPSEPSGFAQVLTKVNQVLANADSEAAGYAQGKVGLTEAVLASEKADTDFEVTMAIRNRALAAYQEIMSLQL